MKAFHCSCGWRIFFENTECLGCNRALGFDPARREMVSLEPAGNTPGIFVSTEKDRRQYRLCRNYHEQQLCNWLLPAVQPREYCLACNLNETITGLGDPKYRQGWANTEAAKRRLLYTLLKLRLPVISKHEDPKKGLAFAFLHDQRQDPDAEHEFVSTGHCNGLITVNLLEADDAARESARVEMNESYRTLLGHFRHESGHYYWQRLVADGDRLIAFREVFGDERRDYNQALKDYYAAGPRSNWHADYISGYARCHPWEDWSETWAHYLHMVDALETARTFGVARSNPAHDELDRCLTEWSAVTIMMNELNRSVGQYDAYPFVLSKPIMRKLDFVHEVVRAGRGGPRALRTMEQAGLA
jgi:hypothetical protein